MIDNLFLSVGAMKAGTTWLYNQFRHHPEVYFTPEKELHYFAYQAGISNKLTYENRVKKLQRVSARVAKNNIVKPQQQRNLEWFEAFSEIREVSDEWYEHLFSFKNDEKFCADFSNVYCLMGKEGWSNVRKISKNIKVVYTLRDPFKRLWSHYKFHQKFSGKESQTLEVTTKQFERLLDKEFFWRNAQYADNYLRLKENLADNELMILYMEDTIGQPKQALIEIQKFLGISVKEMNKARTEDKFNATKDFELPDEWREIMMIKLQPEVEKMKKVGLWYDGWLDF